MTNRNSGVPADAGPMTLDTPTPSKNILDSPNSDELTVLAVTNEEVAKMSELDIKFELSRLRGMVSGIALQRALIQEQDRALEAKQAALKEVEKTYLDALAKVQPAEQSTSPTAGAQQGSGVGMRTGSRTERIWQAVRILLEERGGPTYRDDIAEHVLQLGLVPRKQKNAIFNLLSEYKKSGLIETDYRGYWYLPHQSALGVRVRWSPSPKAPGGNGNGLTSH